MYHHLVTDGDQPPASTRESSMGLPYWLGGAPGKDRFAQIMIRELTKAGATPPIVYEPDRFLLRLGTDDKHVVHLHNAYADYCAARPFRRRRALTPYLGLAHLGEDTIPATFAQAAPNLLPLVHGKDFLFLSKMSLSDEAAQTMDWPAIDLGSHVDIHLCFDSEHAASTLGTDTLRDWGVNFEEAMAKARENLWNRSKEGLREVTPGVYVALWGDAYDATRIVLHDLIWQLKVQGDHVALIPSRDALFVTGSDDPQGLVALAKLAEEQLQQQRPVSGHALRLEGKTWVDYLPPAEHPAHIGFVRLKTITNMGAYNVQVEMLESRDQRAGAERFHAKYMVFEREQDKSLRSICAWCEGIEQTLPQADWVSFVASPKNEGGEPETLGEAAWDKAMAIVGHYLKPMEGYPPRFVVEGFPTPEELSRLKLTNLAD